MESENALPVLIGRRVAARRAALKLPLEEVAARTGVSRAMISRIERGEVHASAVVLDKLCAGLGISLSALFARDAASPLLRRADQPVWQDPSSGYRRREVAPAGTGSPVRIVEVDFPAGAEVCFERSRERGHRAACLGAGGRDRDRVGRLRLQPLPPATACTCASPRATAFAMSAPGLPATPSSSRRSRSHDHAQRPSPDPAAGACPAQRAGRSAGRRGRGRRLGRFRLAHDANQGRWPGGRTRSRAMRVASG